MVCDPALSFCLAWKLGGCLPKPAWLSISARTPAEA